jgi:hypothetical protein
MSAQKKITMECELRMIPACHPESSFEIVYVPERGGDCIRIKCGVCYRVFFTVKLPKEGAL